MIWFNLFYLGFLRHRSASLVKSTMPISCPQTFPAIGPKIFWFLMELSLNLKSRILGLSFRAPIALYWPKLFSSGSWQNLSVKSRDIFDMMLQKKLNSFYDRINCNFQTLKCLARNKHITTSISWEITRTLFNRC